VWILVGLGNPGLKYRATRHNVGWLVVDRLLREAGGCRGVRRTLYCAWECLFRGQALLCVKTRTFMNESGAAVAAVLTAFRSAPSDLIVVHDDLGLPPGRIKVSRAKGAGGHRGVASVIEHVGTREFCRVRVGIGEAPPDRPFTDYVLAPFAPEEREIVRRAVGDAAAACLDIVFEGAEKAMTRWNADPAGGRAGEEHGGKNRAEAQN